MSGFDDPIPPARSAGSLVGALAAAQDMPVEALDGALKAPGRIADAVLAVLARADGTEPPARDANLLFWGVHVLAAAQDARLCRPLLDLLRKPSDVVAAWLGDAVTTTLPRIVLGAFDGDEAALVAAVADPDADEFVRWSLFGALAALTWEGRIERATTAAFLARFDAERPARAGDAAWAGWADAIALLGLADLVPLVQAASDDARLLLEPDEKDELNATLAEALARPDDPGRFALRDLRPFGDLVADLEAALDDGEEPEPLEPASNPFRSVGRNDPCPCGSGRKFKKCCLPAA